MPFFILLNHKVNVLFVLWKCQCIYNVVVHPQCGLNGGTVENILEPSRMEPTGGSGSLVVDLEALQPWNTSCLLSAS